MSPLSFSHSGFLFTISSSSTKLLTIKHRMRFAMDLLIHKMRLPEALFLKVIFDAFAYPIHNVLNPVLFNILPQLC